VEQPSGSSTSSSLVARLRHAPADAPAWEEFVRRYGPRIHAWCRGWGLQDADAQDVSQDVLVDIARQMRTFRYDPARSFRAWLKTLAHGAWCDFLSSPQRRVRGGGGGEALRLLRAVEARDDLARRFEEEYDLQLLEEATAQVRQRLEPATWEAFRLLAFEGLTGSAAAARLGMKVGAVFMAKSRVQKLLKEAIARLESACEGGP
jgi:RNA polymerase sigma-70 factor (ECF subfamily)